MFHVDRCGTKVQDQFPQRVKESILQIPCFDFSSSASKAESEDERLFAPWTAEVVSKWATQQRSSIAPSFVRAMLSCIKLICNLTCTRAVCAVVVLEQQIRKIQANRRMIRSIWLAGSRSHRVERMSIARSPDVSWRLGSR
jgi:hypothetical protein